ncbi:MAG: glucosamine-6-phosphate deaminase [Bacteroidia bacterium]|nr:glucosamine-6-phosphate deaminase [Bacteroidia bacterium]MBT8274601.1 glucosamine-6-phosphate deaminase [Bacteroidia bacterium]NNF31307.1 glucosamine-6-phosphate deaminase [Flavobacteriaceae bacterium]NNK54229.1 glucosamine-6-phosphate deaminase [Flavobacteriaceae bacterium]NNM08338.1 glucosamine-6-phosphate deaminase [Flavobacteriaceae bacterium]
MKNIKYQPAGQFESTRFEKIHNVEFNSHIEASLVVASEIAALIRKKETAGETCLLGLATGSSPIKVYDELVRLHKKEGLSFKNVVTFNLDEYYPMEKQNFQSYYHFMHEHLFDHVDILPENINIPNGELEFDEIHQYCIDYEEKILEMGGLDFQLLGIGRTGHIGFNEPGSHINSGTRLITLDHITRVDAADSFLGIDNVPRKAITMGIASVRNARRIVLLAWGQHKAGIIKVTVEGDITSEVPATYLQQHENTTFVLDYEAGSQLTRNKTPWLVGPCEWTSALKSKAIVWLCGQTGKSILRLTDTDYNNHGMSGLLAQEGSAYNFNIEMFNKLQHTITGWPGGKPNADDSKRPERAQPASKRVIVFSPHPDDDVISMGGTLDRLIEQGHDVHVVYQTSGNIAVSNEEALKFAEIASALDTESDLKDEILKELVSGKEHQADSTNLRRLKGLIRRSESYAATRYLGLKDENAHFLNLPFYETGKVKKNELSEADIELMIGVISKIKPHQIYAAGDLGDPHGTHKVCLEALFESLNRMKSESFMKDCWVWLYRGAWHEWQLHEIDMVVPMSPDQIVKKRHAIFYHQSQKDRVMYQGDDDREFWMRAEERNKTTASNYRAVGLADYAAMEAFVRYHF